MTTKPAPEKIVVTGDIFTAVRKRGYRFIRRFGALPTPGDDGMTATDNWPVLLWQHGASKERFAVSYGAELTYCLDWNEAAERLGASLLHASLVDGVIHDA